MPAIASAHISMMNPLPQQLDIFDHSPDVMLRNDVLDALQQRDAWAALAACERLASASPLDAHLPAMRLLAAALAGHDETPLLDHGALATERRRHADELEPAAAHAFNGSDAVHFMRPAWRHLASRCSGLPFDPSRPDDHAAPLWLRAESWAEAERAVERIESWRRIPASLAWMAEAHCRGGKLDGCWALLAELAWLSPRRFDAVARRAVDPLLARLHNKFGSSFDGQGDIDDLAWFPAWVLTEAPALAKSLVLAWPGQDRPAERAMRLLVELLGLERQGRHAELIERRRGLRDLSRPLFGAYMATR